MSWSELNVVEYMIVDIEPRVHELEVLAEVDIVKLVELVLGPVQLQVNRVQLVSLAAAGLTGQQCLIGQSLLARASVNYAS